MLPVTIEKGDKVQASVMMHNLNYLDAAIGNLATSVDALRADMEVAIYNLIGQGIVQGVLDDMVPSIVGKTVLLEAGLAYVQGRRVSYTSPQSVDFTGKGSGVYYVLIDSLGALTAEGNEEVQKMTVCSVSWDGSALSDLQDKRSFFA